MREGQRLDSWAEANALTLDLRAQDGQLALRNVEGPISLVLGKEQLEDELLTTLIQQLSRQYPIGLVVHNLSDRNASLLHRCTHIRMLDLSQSSLTNDGLALVGTIAPLEYLAVPRAISDEGLQHLTALRHLEGLDLSGSSVEGAGLRWLMGLRHLTQLTLPESISDDGFVAATQLHQLQSLLMDATQVSDDAFPAISELRALRRLTLPESVTDNSVAAIGSLTGLRTLWLGSHASSGLAQLRHLPHIRTLHVSGITTDSDVSHIANATQLQSLNLFTAGASLRHLANLTELRTLGIGGIHDSADVRHLAGLTELRWLSLWEFHWPSIFDDEALAHLEGLVHLRTLVVRDLTDRGLRSIGHLVGLETLEIRQADVSSAGLTNLTNLPRLRELMLSGSVSGIQTLAQIPALSSLSITAWGTPHDLNALGGITGLEYLSIRQQECEGIAALGNLTALKNLDLHIDSLTDVDLEFVQRLSFLENLSLESRQLTGRGLRHVGPLHHLQTLRLVCPGITELAELPSMPQLHRLDMVIPLTDVGAAALRRFTELTSLRLRSSVMSDAGYAPLSTLTRLHSLNLTGSAIGDAGLVHLSNLSALHSLRLSDTGITDQGLTHLQGLTRLRWFQYSATRVTDKAVRQILPWL